MMRKLLVLFIAFMLSCNAFAYDASNIAREVASVLRGKAAVRGFPASDPRVTGLVGAAGTVVTEIAVGAAVAGTAPAWGTIIASAVIAGTVGYGINALANWLFNKDGTVTQSSGSSSVPDTSYSSPNTYSIYAPDSQGQITSGSLIGAANGFAQVYTKVYAADGHPEVTISVLECYDSSNQCQFKYNNDAWIWGSFGVSNTTFSGCQTYLKGGQCILPTAPGPTTKPVQEAIEALPELQKGVAIPAQTIADVADAVWRLMASKPGYSGVPYSFSDPVTATDVEADRAANPSRSVPRIGDLAAPISTSNPLAEPPTSPVNDPAVNPSTQPQVNLGNDPGIGAPTLEATPTAQQIIDPLASLAPSLKSWVVPAHVAECPKPEFDLFNKHIVMDQQCTMFEDNRATLYNAMLVAWALVALFIILSA